MWKVLCAIGPAKWVVVLLVGGLTGLGTMAVTRAPSVPNRDEMQAAIQQVYVAAMTEGQRPYMEDRRALRESLDRLNANIERLGEVITRLDGQVHRLEGQVGVLISGGHGP